MNKRNFKLLSILAIFVFVAIMPIIVLATNNNVSKDVSIVNTTNENNEQEYMIYIEGYANTKFKYALSNNAQPEEMDLYYINSISDLGENQVAFLDADTYKKLSEETVYMWAKDENQNLILEGIQLDFQKSISKENIDLVESLTKRIDVEIADNKESTQTVRNENVEGIEETAAVGYVKITDSEDAKYSYQTMPVAKSEEYAKLMELAKEIQDKYDEMDMYQKVQIDMEFYNLYSKLVNEAEWQTVENMMIEQPEASVAGDKYIVFLKKEVEGNPAITDAQFLTAYEDYQPNVVKEEIITQETAKLPITYDNITLIVILAVIVIALVLIFIRMKKLNKKDETK